MGEDVCPSNTSKSKNANPNGRRVRPPTDDQYRMAELYAGGMRCEEIADQFDCDLAKVYRTLRKLGVKMRPSAAVRRIPKKKHPRIVQYYEAGRSCREIAEKFGCSKENIRDILQKHDVKMRPAHSHGRYSEETCRKMADLYRQGHPRRHIAARFGCDPTTLNRALLIQGIELPPALPCHFITQADREMIVKLHHQGQSRSEIAAKIGCVPQTIGKILRKLGVLIRVRGPEAYSAEEQQRMADLYEIGIPPDEIAVGFDCCNGTVYGILRKLGVKIRSQGSASRLPRKKRGQILDAYKEGCSGAEIAARFECSLEAVAAVIELATRKSRVAQRLASLSNSNAVDDSGEDTESPVVETPPISLETLVRNFWTDQAGAVDILLLPPDQRLKITESVEQALLYAWNAFGKRWTATH